jgi:hypothetical protein
MLRLNVSAASAVAVQYGDLAADSIGRIRSYGSQADN